MKEKSILKKTSFKVASAVVLFIVFVVAFSLLIYLPAEKPYNGSNDYDTVFIGASVSTRAVDPKLIDEKTGSNSYVLASKGSPIYGRCEMLDAALKDISTIDTVVIEVTYYTLIKKIEEYTLEERLLFFPKISGPFHKLAAAKRRFSFMADEYDELYGQLIYDGMDVWGKILNGEYDEWLAARGHDPYGYSEQQIDSKEEALATYNTNELSVNFEEQNIADLTAMIEECQGRGLDVVIVTMPMSQKFIWQSTGLDEYHETIQKIADDHGISFYDFNLLENIQDYFDDSYSYHDEEHLSKHGAPVMSEILGEVLNAELNNGSSKYSFYSSYDEAKEHSIYNY